MVCAVAFYQKIYSYNTTETGIQEYYSCFGGYREQSESERASERESAGDSMIIIEAIHES